MKKTCKYFYCQCEFEPEDEDQEFCSNDCANANLHYGAGWDDRNDMEYFFADDENKP